jgi:hypothetical protein
MGAICALHNGSQGRIAALQQFLTPGRDKASKAIKNSKLFQSIAAAYLS